MLVLLGLLLAPLLARAESSLRGTGDLAIVIERAHGTVQVLDTTSNKSIGVVQGLGDLSHASAVYSRDGRYAFVFGRDGGLSKVDLLTASLVARVVQAGNSIGGAISQDGRLIAVSNYTPGGVKVFDAATLEPVADIPAEYAPGQRSKVIGLVDAPGQRFVFSLWDAGQTWVVDMRDPANPSIAKFEGIGRNPYDALISPDGRFYIAGLFGEDGLALLDLWQPEKGVRRVLADYGRRCQASGVQDAAPGRLGGRRYERFRAGGRSSRGAGDRYDDLAAGRAHTGAWSTGVRHGASGRASDMGQFRHAGQ